MRLNIPSMTKLPPLPPLLWLDLETTGIDPHKHEPLEAALVATDPELNIEDKCSFVIHWGRIELNLTATTHKMHTDNGLLADVNKATDGFYTVDCKLREWIKEHGFENRTMAGSSVQFERKWCGVWFIAIRDMFHYRNFDVRTLRTWYGLDKPEVTHRALDDLLVDIETVRSLRR